MSTGSDRNYHLRERDAITRRERLQNGGVLGRDATQRE